MIKEIKNFKRKELFDHYHSCDNPFIICTIPIDVTNVVKYCKEHKNFYATMGFLITKTVNQIEEFKYRYKGGKIYYCDIINSNFTQMYEDNTIGFFGFPYTNDFNQYIENYLETQNEFKKNKELITENNIDEIWLSCEPWFSFSSFIPPFDKKISIPQFIWDKFENVDGRYNLNLMIMIHHGFADGFHVAKFINLLKENIISFSK